MKKNNEWAITFDVLKMGEGGEPAEVYNSLEQKLGTFLEKQFVNCEFVDDSCDGEEYAVRFKVFSDKSLDKRDLASKQIPIGNSIWEVSGLEIREFKKVYIEEQFKDLSDRYGQNRNPFEDLTFKLIDEAIKCYSEGLYDGVVILCRSSIDSSLYLACVWARNKVDKETYEYRNPKPFEPRLKVPWRRLKDESVKLGFLSSEALDEIEEVRDLGNFAAHIGKRQLKEMREWAKKNSEAIKTILKKGLKGFPDGYKMYTLKDEVYHAIASTVDFLMKLSDGYNRLQ